VLVSFADSRLFIETKREVQMSFPASNPWVLACGGTIGKVNRSSVTEYVWNDTWQGRSERHWRYRQHRWLRWSYLLIVTGGAPDTSLDVSTRDS
jgi:hypothetical protein